jgi:hypothetical protein
MNPTARSRDRTGSGLALWPTSHDDTRRDQGSTMNEHMLKGPIHQRGARGEVSGNVWLEKVADDGFNGFAELGPSAVVLVTAARIQFGAGRDDWGYVTRFTGTRLLAALTSTYRAARIADGQRLFAVEAICPVRPYRTIIAAIEQLRDAVQSGGELPPAGPLPLEHRAVEYLLRGADRFTDVGAGDGAQVLWRRQTPGVEPSVIATGSIDGQTVSITIGGYPLVFANAGDLLGLGQTLV